MLGGQKEKIRKAGLSFCLLKDWTAGISNADIADNSKGKMENDSWRYKKERIYIN